MNKTNRIHVLMSDGELQALDEWRFANKIGSRGEAIRRLLASGMAPKPKHNVREIVDNLRDKS